MEIERSRLTEFFDEELNASGGDGVVRPLPVEDVGEVAAGLE